MKNLNAYLSIGIFALASVSANVMAEVGEGSTAAVFSGTEPGIIEISGDAAQVIYDGMKQVEEKKTFAESTKVGSNIRCSKLGLNPKLKNSPTKKHTFKCFFRVGEKGDLTAPVVIK